MPLCKNSAGLLIYQDGKLCTECGGPVAMCACCNQTPPTSAWLRILNGMTGDECTNAECDVLEDDWEQIAAADCRWEATDNLPCIGPFERIIELFCSPTSITIDVIMKLNNLNLFLSTTLTQGTVDCNALLFGFTPAHIVNNAWTKCSVDNYGPLDHIVQLWFSQPT